jgi:phosphoglycerol transferase MdoB-like AlkP superfamily enzyme
MEHRRKSYARATSRFDAQLIDLLKSALDSPLSENLYIIITSDHGEGLGEPYGDDLLWRHKNPPYAEQTHIPLILYGDRVGVSDQLVGLDDVAGAILAMAGIEGKRDRIFSEREQVRADYIAFDRSDDVRYVTTIRQNKREMVSFDDKPAQSTSSPVPESLSDDLKALGYLN